MTGDQWYSDAALAKQAKLKSNPGNVTWKDLLGIYEPRIHATESERCPCCGSDARDGAGGEVGANGKRYCSICIGRGHDDD